MNLLTEAVCLRDLVNAIGSVDDELTIYAVSPWTPDSMAVLAMETDDGGVPPIAGRLGMSYFLEVFIANEVLSELAGADLDERTSRLIQYAITDA